MIPHEQMSHFEWCRSLEITDVKHKEHSFSGIKLLECINQSTDAFSDLDQGDIVFLDMGRTVETITTILSCLTNNIAFTFCRENAEEYESYQTTCTYDGKKCTRIRRSDPRNEEICYVITTSGTTGRKKQVAVTRECIMMNIDHFIDIFNLNPTDKVLFSTDFLFDPSIVELFIAFKVGCSILLCPDYYRSQPERLSRVLLSERPQFAQFTPNVFQSIPGVEEVLGEESPLKVLLLGGSKFPLEFVKNKSHASNKTRIYDVYGVTEVSCWATIREVTMRCEEVTLGVPVNGSTISISSNRTIVIGGSRKCYVNGKVSGPAGHDTGDIIKYKGVRINLEDLTEGARNKLPVDDAYFMIYEDQLLVLFVIPRNVAGIKYLIPQVFKELPKFKLEILDVFPVNTSGKVDRNALKEILDRAVINEKFTEFVQRRMKMEMSKCGDKSFVEMGVDSMLAAELSLYFASDSREIVMRAILDPYVTIGQFMQNHGNNLTRKESESEVISITLKCRINRQPDMIWSYDTGKCIDGNTVIIRESDKTYALAASHSGIICCIVVESGKLQWEQRFPHRFQASPIVVDDYVVIGGLNGFVYCKSIENGDVIWTIGTGDEIKAECCYDNQQNIYCISYSGYIYQIDKKTGVINWQYQCHSGSPVAPIIYNDSVIFTTINGYVHRVRVDGTLIWKYHTSNACFSKVVIHNNEYLLIADVSGKLHYIDIIKGGCRASMTTGVPVFCEPVIHDNVGYIASNKGDVIELDINDMKVIRRFNFDIPNMAFVKSPIVTRNGKNMEILSTNGLLITIDMDKCTVIRCLPLVNPTQKSYSYPVYVSNQLLLSTGRDNYLRCYRIA